MSSTQDPKEDEDYRESEDEDYNPDIVAAEGYESDESDEHEEEFEKESKNQNYDAIQGGGLIKTRSQRIAEEAEEKEFKKSQEQSSVDVDDLWKSMNNAPEPKEEVQETKIETEQEKPKLEEEYITIKRTYKFAGTVHTEEKKVPKSSAEARAYLGQEQNQPTEGGDKKPLKRPAKRSSLETELAAGKPKKMTTLEKSRLDWAGFVDQEGIKDDLVHHNKGGYLQKQDFLNRVEHKLDQDWKAAKKKN